MFVVVSGCSIVFTCFLDYAWFDVYLVHVCTRLLAFQRSLHPPSVLLLITVARIGVWRVSRRMSTGLTLTEPSWSSSPGAHERLRYEKQLAFGIYVLISSFIIFLSVGTLLSLIFSDSIMNLFERTDTVLF